MIFVVESNSHASVSTGRRKAAMPIAAISSCSNCLRFYSQSFLHRNRRKKLELAYVTCAVSEVRQLSVAWVRAQQPSADSALPVEIAKKQEYTSPMPFIDES